MTIIKKLLIANPFSRPGKQLSSMRAIILHNTGVAGQRALTVFNHFQDTCMRQMQYASAHYAVDLDGTVYQFIPDNEVAYHCGTTLPDPKSGRVYTDWARSVFGRFADNYKINSPNNASIGIELCMIDHKGNFDPRTIDAAVQLVADLSKKYQIPVEHIGTHNLVVGWKSCPLLWTYEPYQFDAFKAAVERRIG